MLRDIGSNIDQIAVSLALALALVTTFYGIVLANAVFKPMVVKLRRRTQDRVTLLTLTNEAIVMMADRHSPAQLRYTLQSFLGIDIADAYHSRPTRSAAQPHHVH